MTSATLQPPLPSPLLSSFFVFKNIFSEELIKSVHVYKACNKDGEKKERWVEREFLFSPTSCIEIRTPSFGHQLLPGSTADMKNLRHQEGEVVGLWLCIFAFDSANPSISSTIPPILCFSRNPRLHTVQSLASDLNKVFQLWGMPTGVSDSSIVEITHTGENVITANSAIHHQAPMSDSYFRVMQKSLKDNDNSMNLPETSIYMKKKRAATEHVASIALQDLEKYFNLPIAEASRKLKVGLSVLKRKCREYGILRWPHRKIKSLDTLIHSVQEEVTQQEQENKAAGAKAAARRQQMLESEKKCIETRPFMELQRETKLFRQDIFKRRHRAKVQSKKSDNKYLRH